MDMLGRYKIHITHFANPHSFWFYKGSSQDGALAKIREVEYKLETLYKSQQRQPDYKPQIGEHAAVYILSYRNFIRCQILNIEDFYGVIRYIVWAQDYGMPIRTSIDSIWPLPEKLSYEIDYIQVGGLTGLLPAEKLLLSPGQSTTTVTAQQKWSKRAVQSFADLLAGVSSAMFREDFRESNGHIWGHLQIRKHPLRMINIRNYLIRNGFAVQIGPSFREICVSLKTTSILPWLTNESRTKCLENSLTTHTMRLRYDFSTELCDDGYPKIANLIGLGVKLGEKYRNGGLPPKPDSALFKWGPDIESKLTVMKPAEENDDKSASALGK